MAKKKIHITEKQFKALMESSMNEVFGFTGRDFENMGLKNPVNDYVVNYSELIAKCQEFGKCLQEFKNYISGVEEDAEAGVKEKQGVKFVMSMRAMWSGDEDEKGLVNELKTLDNLIWKMESELQDVQEASEWLAKMSKHK